MKRLWPSRGCCATQKKNGVSVCEWYLAGEGAIRRSSLLRRVSVDIQGPTAVFVRLQPIWDMTLSVLTEYSLFPETVKSCFISRPNRRVS